ncbi:MAG: polyphosphate kinase 1 [Rikenellaceae bacterium]
MASQTYNRELSWLQFNDRVLQEAQDKSVPLVQRLRFLGIFSNNQDEFIKVRVARLMNYSMHKSLSKIVTTGGYTPSQLLPHINQRMDISQVAFRETYRSIIEEMESEGIYVVDQRQLSEEQMEFCREYFLTVLAVRLGPIIIRKRMTMPFLPDAQGYLAVKMTAPKSTRYAIIQIPVSDASPRFVKLPSAEGRVDIIFVDDIIRLFLDDIFFMFSYDTISAHMFKILRDASLTIDDDASKSLTEKMYESISERERGRTVRMVCDREMPLDLLEMLSKKLGFTSKDHVDTGGKYHVLRDLMDFPRVRPDLENRNPKPLLHPLIDPCESVLKVIKERDILMAYPYHSFKHFINLLREAAIDPMVQSISITLYRTASHSKVISSLLNAVKNGKQVTVLVELKARFDEERNIDNTETLQRGGVKVIPTQSMLKVHSKLVLIERREGNAIRGYTYVGTGNFNEKTAGIYSDFGLLTANQVVANDARKIFTFLENTHLHPVCKQLLVTPYNMRNRIVEMLNTEIRNAQKGKKAKFWGKFNSLTDEKMIALLYKASQAGVKIKLLIRGACCLQAGVKGLSENIEVRSIVDKYLEHARVMIFHNGGKNQTYILSADLMTRNLDRRVEVGIPVSDPDIERSVKDYFSIQWSDNVKAREIAVPTENRYIKNDEEPCRSQDALYTYFENAKR